MVDTPPEDAGDRPDDRSDPSEESPAHQSTGGGRSRRDLLKLGVVGMAGIGAAAGGGYLLMSGAGTPSGEWNAGSSEIDEEVVERLAPLLQFGAHEPWYPTDPRQYTTEQEGNTVVDGFTALNEYTAAARAAETPPEPVVFYRTLAEANSTLGVVQYWQYSVFDQFATNFHWHDWELVQVFFDRETDEVALVAASSHSRSVPNNEHIGGPDSRIAILSEVGSHSSATDIDNNGQFSRLRRGDLAADVSNALVRVAEDLNPLPLAYGLPRDEGGLLPYAVPELDGSPLYEHPDLPDVRVEDLIDEPLAVREQHALSSPPTDLPAREAGLQLPPAVDDATDEGDPGYTLAPIEPVAEAIDDFVGPQLSFEFAIPGIVEDQFAGHLTSVGLPWTQPRYDNPLADVTDATHRQRIVDQFGIGSPERDGDIVVTQVQEATGETDGEIRGAPDTARTDLEPEIGYTLADPSVESMALLESEAVAVPSVGGAILLTSVDPGEHRLVVNGAGYAPHAERLSVGGDDGAELPVDETDSGTNGSDAPDDAPTIPVTRGGANGYLTAVPRAEAVKLRAEAPDAPGGIDRVRIAEDYAGAAFDGKPAGGDGNEFAVYVHQAGSYVVDLVDGEGVPGAARVKPQAAEDEAPTVDLSGDTGKASLAGFLAEFLQESADLTREYRQGDETDGDGTTTTTTTTTTRTGNGNGNGNATGGGETPTQTETGDGADTGGGDGGGGNGTPGVPEIFESAAGAAERAAGFAREERFDQADRQLETVQMRLDALGTRIEAQRGGVIPDTLATVLLDRVTGSDRRAAAALAADR